VTGVWYKGKAAVVVIEAEAAMDGSPL